MDRKMMYLVSMIVLGAAVSALAAEPGLVGWWQFNEGSGTKAADSSGNNNNGTLSGPVTWDMGWDGTACLSFNGPYNFVRVPDNASLNMTDGITITAWVNPRWTGNNRIMQKSSEGSDDQYRLLKEGGNNIRFHVPPFPNLEATGFIPAKGEWSHLAGTYDGKEVRIYLNGKMVASQAATGKMGTSNGPLFIGTKHSTAPAGDEYNGLMDDVRIYNRGLSAAEIKAFVPAKLKAMKPNPADGATSVAMPLLQWTAGETAMFHSVYLGTTPDLTEANLVASRQPVAMFYYVAGLQPGVTYYWRVDEIDLAGVVTTGDVWKFRAAQKTAGDPKPGNGAKWVNPAGLTLTWIPGSTAIKHELYFGTNQEDVKNGTGGTAKGTQVSPQFDTGALTGSTTYYWRVDEIEASGAKQVGDVWSFETVRPGGGILGQYFATLNPAGNPVLTRLDPAIDFNWGTNAPAPGVPAPNYSVRWTGEIDVPFAEKYTFYASVQGGIRLWVNGQLVIEYWMQHHMEVEYDGSITLERGRYPIVMEFANLQWSGGSAIAHLSWSSPSISKQIIPAGPLQPPYWAQAIYPRDKAVDVPQDVTLMWSAGYKAKQHDVYFGTDPAAVANATPQTADVYVGRQALDKGTYGPGTLEWNKTYYWRVDEVNDADAASPWTGVVWSFTTANSVVVDNFETYTDNEGSRIYETWIDGFTNNTGSIVGNAEEPFAEQVIVHGGRQSMPMDYNNLKTPFYSEAERSFTPALNCTVNGVDTLSLFFRGLTNNGPDTVYIALEDSAGQVGVVSYSDTLAVLSMKWIEWKIPLSQFAGVDAAKVKKVYVGVGDRKNPKAGGAGRLYFDDIRVMKAAP
ncbi:MAG: PA14 domain-containing protein [Planctomycetes bacterium]|nr:PA14 domain-containing protein [Planctomycetota bacterium]